MPITPRHLRRYRQIVEVLARHGFGVLLSQLGLEQQLHLPHRLFGKRPSAPELSVAQHVRVALEELGPAFIKLGQLLSTRPDLIPPEVISELRRLQDDAPQLPWTVIEERIQAELGRPAAELFASIDPAPLAAASLAQVHAATLPDGRPVAIKVQRPDIQPTINLDLDILNDLAHLAQERTPLGQVYDLVEVAEDFAATLRSETDYRREGRNADRLRAAFEGEPQLVIPRVYWEYSTRHVLVMERIEGIKIDDLTALDAAGYDRHRVALICARMIIKEVLEDGFFHADPHPGNFVVMPGERIGAMDFGKVGSLDSGDRAILLRLYISVVQQDTANIVTQLVHMGVAGPHTDRPALQRDLRRLLTQYHGMTVEDIHVHELVEQLMQVAFRHHLRLPGQLWLLGQTLAMMEGLSMQLDPGFDLFEASEPYVQRFSRQLWLPAHWGPTLLRSLTDWAELAINLPRHTRRLLEQAEQGEFETRIHISEMPRTISRLDRIANRLSVAILLSAFILALAWLIPSMSLVWPWPWFTWLAVAGFVTISLLGVWLLWNIWRSGR